jgi:hypothetical protein
MGVELKEQSNCLNCGELLTGKFCSACGQKLIESSERTFKHVLFQFFGSAFFIENNFLRNLWVLLTKPGQQSLDFIQGRTKRWMTPFSIFLLINLFYFLINPLSDFSLALSDQVQYQLHSSFIKPMVDKRIEDRGITFKDYAQQYKLQSDTLAKTIIIINVPITALFFMMWFYRRKMFFVDHFIFFIHFYGWLLLTAITLTVLFQALILVGLISNVGVAGPILLWILLTIYLAIAIRKVYEQKKVYLLASVLFGFVALAATHIMYRFILFMLTFWTT